MFDFQFIIIQIHYYFIIFVKYIITIFYTIFIDNWKNKFLRILITRKKRKKFYSSSYYPIL